MGQGSGRLAYIDALRGWAILGVIVTHAASLAGASGLLRQLTDAGGRGVELFFVVSAFTIFLTLSKGVAREAAPYRNFFIRRMMRLLPVYWLGVIVYALVYGNGSRGWKAGPDFWHYPMHLTLTNDLHPLVTSSAVPGGWSISCEAMFYLTAPLWFMILRGWRSATVFAVVTMIAGPAIIAVLRHFIDPGFADVPPSDLRQFWFRSPISQLGTFACGMMLYFLTRDRPPILDRLAVPAINIALLLAGSALLLLEAVRPLPVIQLQYVFGIGFLMIALSLSAIPWGALVNRATVFVGKVSYSAYLTHFLVIKQVSLLVPQGTMSPLTYTALLMVLCIAPILLLSWLGYLYVERPTTDLARRWIERAEGRRTQSGPELQTAP